MYSVVQHGPAWASVVRHDALPAAADAQVLLHPAMIRCEPLPARPSAAGPVREPSPIPPIQYLMTDVHALLGPQHAQQAQQAQQGGPNSAAFTPPVHLQQQPQAPLGEQQQVVLEALRTSPGPLESLQGSPSSASVSGSGSAFASAASPGPSLSPAPTPPPGAQSGGRLSPTALGLGLEPFSTAEGGCSGQHLARLG